MRKAALKPVWKRKFIHTTHSRHDGPWRQFVLNRQFNPVAPDTAYVLILRISALALGGFIWRS
ncbi:MAG: hypothetical protein HS120_07265 [Burkholderiales bacterium]|nr:hypothetical protein [Burkholderiales bacterium]